MNTIGKLSFVIVLVLALLLVTPGSVRAAALPDTVIGGSFTLEAGEVLDEDLVVIGGNALIEHGATVNGEIKLLGGALEIEGVVYGNVVATGGFLRLASTAEIHGDVSTLGAVLDRDPEALITGKLHLDSSAPFGIELPGGVRLPNLAPVFSPFWSFLVFLAQVFIFSALAVLVTMFFPKQITRTAQTITAQPLVAGGLGILTVVIFPFVLLVMVVTILLIPVACLAVLALGLMIIMGWIALGYEVGRRFAAMFNREWAAPVSAGLGTFALSLVIAGLASLSWVVCLGSFLMFILASAGLGAVLLTRFGMQDYPGLANPVFVPTRAAVTTVSAAAAAVVPPPAPEAPVATTPEEPENQ